MVARSVVVPQTVPKHLMISDKIIRFQFPNLLDVNYINMVNNSIFSREYYGTVAGGTSTSMKNVTRNHVSLLPVPLSSRNEQGRIISTVTSIFSLCDFLKTRIIRSEEIKKNLTDTVTFYLEH